MRMRVFACVCVRLRACVRTCERATCPRLALARLCSWGPELSQLHFSLSTVMTLYIHTHTLHTHTHTHTHGSYRTNLRVRACACVCVRACVRACVRFVVNVTCADTLRVFFCTHHALLGVAQGGPELKPLLSPLLSFFGKKKPNPQKFAGSSRFSGVFTFHAC